MSRMHVRDLIKVSGTSESWGYAFNGNSYIKLHFFCLRTIQGDEKRERPLWNSSAQTDGCYRKVHEKFKM